MMKCRHHGKQNTRATSRQVRSTDRHQRDHLALIALSQPAAVRSTHTSTVSFRSSMPTDANESSMAAVSTPLDANADSPSTGNPLQSPPSTISLQTPTVRSASPSKQLDKLKRFFSTLYHFGSDISNETGERVRTLILALIVSGLWENDQMDASFDAEWQRAREKTSSVPF